MKRIGMIGLGHMGQPMARNLLKAGFDLIAFDVVKANAESLQADGATVANSIEELVKAADCIITMVQTSEQVSDLCLGENGFFQYMTPDQCYIDCSSIDIASSQAVHAAAKAKNIQMLDAPVSGGVAGATAGTLTFMIGGEKAVFERAKPVFDVLGKNIIHAGGPGCGQAAKICNNMLLAISMVGTCEAFALAKKVGLDEKIFYDISSKASGQCWSMTSYCPVPGIMDNVPANNDYEPGFMAKMMLKDLRLAQHAAESSNGYIPMGSKVTELYENFVNSGEGETDFSGIIKMISQNST